MGFPCVGASFHDDSSFLDFSFSARTRASKQDGSNTRKPSTSVHIYYEYLGTTWQTYVEGGYNLNSNG